MKTEVIEEDPRTGPIGFTEEVLGLSLYTWQDKALAPLEYAGVGQPIVQISVISPNEGGKSTRLVAPAALYWVALHPKGKVVITTKDGKQLDNQIIPAIEAHMPKFEGWKSVKSPYYKVTTPTGGKIIAYTTDSAANVEGAHSDGPDAPLLIIVDEAKSVAEDIFDGFDRCGYRALMYVSSGGIEVGTFFKSHTENRAAFTCVKAGLLDCPHISQDKIDRIIAKHGLNAPFTRSCLYGEFMKQEDSEAFIFPLDVLEACRENPPRHRPGLKAGFCDFGGANAEHTFCVRDGNKAEIQYAWRDANKLAAASRFVYEFRKSGLTAEQIWGDAADSEMLKLLAELGWAIRGQNFGHKAGNDEEYQSWSAEAWHETALAVLKHEIIIPDDEILISQLTSRKKTVVGRGKKGAEEKYDMAKRGVPSPDRGDAYCGVFNIRDIGFVYKEAFHAPLGGWVDEMENAPSREVLEECGAFAGN